LQKLLYHNRPLYGLSAPERASQIAFVFNDPELSIVGSTAKEDIKYVFSALDREPPNSRVCERYGFSREKLARRVDVLSGGELHRLLCLTAIERHPSLLFVDLSRSNLDDDFVTFFFDLVEKLRAEGCCVLVSGLSPHPLHNVFNFAVSDEGNVEFKSEWTSQDPTLDEQALTLQRLVCPRGVETSMALELVGTHRVCVTQPVSVQVRRGEIVTIFGPNGCGKTTLGMIITGRCNRSECGGRPPQMPDDIKPVLALQYASRAFIEDSLAAEETDKEFWYRLGFTNDELTAYPRSLTYGKQKLAACALALKRSRGLCILDEPTCGMNYAMREQFVDLLNEFPKTAVVIFTHDNALTLIGRRLEFGELSV